MAGLGVRIVSVAAGKECGFYLGRKSGVCEEFKQWSDRVRFVSLKVQTGYRCRLLDCRASNEGWKDCLSISLQWWGWTGCVTLR